MIAAVVLAGGAARRLAGVDKPALLVRGAPMLDLVLAAASSARPRVVVGPARAGLPADVRTVQEYPPRAGPVAALAAGLAEAGAAAGAAAQRPDAQRSDAQRSDAQRSDAQRSDAQRPIAEQPIAEQPDAEPRTAEPAGSLDGEVPALVAVLAADLPYLTSAALDTLAANVNIDDDVDGAVYVDGDGRRQLLCGVWRTRVLVRRLAAIGDPSGMSMRAFVAPLRVAEVTHPGADPPPWFDCDTEEDLRQARGGHR